MTTTAKKWGARTGGIIFGLLMACLMLEIVMRVGFMALPHQIRGTIQHVRVYPWQADSRLIPIPPFLNDLTFSTYVKPNITDYPIHAGQDAVFHVTTIDLWGSHVGFRTGEPQWPVQIVTLGDSFTICFTEIEDCWDDHLRRDYGWSIMNLGMYATGTRSHLRVLEGFAVPLEPDVVIWQWYGNDFYDDYGLALWNQETPPLGDPAPQPDPPPDYGTLSNYSTVYTLLRRMADTTPRSDPGYEVPANGKTLLVGNEYFLYAFDFDSPAVAYGWEESLKHFDQAETIIKEQLQAEWVIVLIPTKEEVYADFVVDTLGEDYLTMLREGRDRMNDLCEERGWHCIDPTERLREEVKAGRHVYYPVDLHLNPYGNEILAEMIGDYLVEAGLLVQPDKSP